MNEFEGRSCEHSVGQYRKIKKEKREKKKYEGRKEGVKSRLGWESSGVEGRGKEIL